MVHCSICSKEFKSYQALNAHLRVHNSAGGAYAPGARRNGRVEYRCIGCEEPYAAYPSAGKKFCSNRCQHDYAWANETKPRVESGGTKDRLTLVKYVTERDGYSCSECGLEDWNGKPISLDLDHIDGNPANNLPNNLRFLCPNCHRQTDSWGNCAMKREAKNGRRKQNIDPRGTMN